MIIAKPVIEKQYWILQKDNQKIGNAVATGDGVEVTINNQVERYKTIRMAAQRANIEFLPSERTTKPDAHLVHGYPAAGRVYNPVWDVPRHLPLYTKTRKSKSWFAAGWYAIKRGRSWRVVRDPKLIALDRYQYHGPFHEQTTAKEHAHD